MNKRLILYVIGSLLLVEAAAMLPSLGVALYFGDGDALAFVQTMLLLVAIGLPLRLLSKPRKKDLGPREGFIVVAAIWVLLSLFGCLPFMLSGMIPHFADAFFETVSGFTITGATIMSRMEMQPRGVMFWRSFTHWIGGMGVLVLTLALLPQMTGRTAHLMKAESPGPTLSKLVPKMGDSAKILYIIYGVITAVQAVVLMLAGMNLYDALIHAFGTVGTGGFSNYTASISHFESPLIEWIITFFMLLCGVNFALFYRAAIGDWRGALKNEEMRWFLGIVGAFILGITLMILPQYGDLFTALRHSAFQVASVVSTTGYMTQDFNLWFQAAKMLLVLLMFMGGCAGSTAGGLKVIRVSLLLKMVKREVRRTFQPRKMQVVRFEGKGVDEQMLSGITMFFCTYILMLLAGTFVVSLENTYGFTENFTAALTCISNVGPGLGAVGPASNFAGYGPLSKFVLSFLMLAGRLEIFPMLILFHPAIWKRK
ncbi:MAG: TrkH family potassium uptake protein [Clostridia bacterium]|nr:TrkH family potassium uptake protein [Clostridia bacterium]